MENRKCPGCGSDKIIEQNEKLHCENCGLDFSLDSNTTSPDEGKAPAVEENSAAQPQEETPAPTVEENTPAQPQEETPAPAVEENSAAQPQEETPAPTVEEQPAPIENKEESQKPSETKEPTPAVSTTGKVIKKKYQKKLMIARYPSHEFAFGDSLLVGENQLAIFMEDKYSIGYFKPGKYILNESTLSLGGRGTEKGKFTADLFFVNLPKDKTIQWEAYIRTQVFTGEKYETGNIRASGDYLFSLDDLEKFLVYASGQEKIGEKGLTIKEVKAYVIPAVLVNMRNEFPRIIQKHLHAQTSMNELKIKVQDEMFAFLNQVIHPYGMKIWQYQIKEMTSEDIAIRGGSGKKGLKVFLKILITLIVLGGIGACCYFFLWPWMKDYFHF